MVLEDAVSMSG